MNLTPAKAGTLRETLRWTQDRHDREANPLQDGREYEPEEAYDLITAAREQSGLAGRAGDKVDQAMTEYIPAAEPPAIDPQTGHPIGVGPHGETGAGYVEEYPATAKTSVMADDTRAAGYTPFEDLESRATGQGAFILTEDAPDLELQLQPAP